MPLLPVLEPRNQALLSCFQCSSNLCLPGGLEIISWFCPGYPQFHMANGEHIWKYENMGKWWYKPLEFWGGAIFVQNPTWSQWVGKVDESWIVSASATRLNRLVKLSLSWKSSAWNLPCFFHLWIHQFEANNLVNPLNQKTQVCKCSIFRSQFSSFFSSCHYLQGSSASVQWPPSILNA